MQGYLTLKEKIIMEIWITRHGCTNLNEKNLMQGRTDEPLNEIGIQQAREARKRIGNITFDAVYSSPLERALLTASILRSKKASQNLGNRRFPR